MAKTYSGTFLYRQYSEYEKEIFSFMMTGTEIDKDVDSFDDIKYDVKRRQVGNSLVKVLESKQVVLLTNKKPLPKSFKVFCAKDIKGPKKDKMKVFIDCSGIISEDNASGAYTCKGNNIDIFISYLVSAMHTLIYYADENRIVSNTKIMHAGAQAFASLITQAIDSVYKLSSMHTLRNKCMYLASLYYLSNLLGKDYTSEGSRKIAKKISGLSDRDAGIVDISIKKETMMDINYFVQSLSDILHLNKLTVDVLTERWMMLYGTGTVFALEMFPAFASMLTDAYVGAFVNSQKRIETVAGATMTEFTKTILSIGSESI